MSSPPTWVVFTHAMLPHGAGHRLVAALQQRGRSVAFRAVPLPGATRWRAERLLPGAPAPQVLVDDDRLVPGARELLAAVEMTRFAWQVAHAGSRDVVLVGCDPVSFLLGSGALAASPLRVRARALWLVDWSAQRLDRLLRGLANRSAARSALALADVAAAISAPAAEAVAALTGGQVDVQVLPNLPLAWPALPPWDRRPPGVVYLGGLSDHQGAAVLVAAGSRLASAGLSVEIAGDGPAAAYVASEVAGVAGVRFHGLVAEMSALAALMGRARVGWALYDPEYPLHVYNDPLKIKDDVAAGLRVVSTLPTSIDDGVVTTTACRVADVVEQTRRLLEAPAPADATAHPLVVEPAGSLQRFIERVEAYR